MTTVLQDEIARVPGESVIPTDLAPVQAANPIWTLTGDVWETVTTEETTVLDWVGTAELTPRMQYVLTVNVHASADAQQRWLVHQTYYDGGTLVLADGAANINPTTRAAAGEWVATARAWNAPGGVVEGWFATEITAPVGTTIQLRAPFVAPLDGPLVVRRVVAGDPDGARVVLAGDALTSYDATGTETARITGEGGEFVGGSFRTSDNLPGQVRIADDAFTYSGQSIPGIEITPEDTRYTALPAGVGPWGTGTALRGGEDTSGRSSTIHATPTQAGITSTSPTGDAQVFASSNGISAGSTRTSDGDHGHLSVDYMGVNLTATDGETGENGEVTARPRDLRMTLRDGSGNTSGQIRVAASTSSISNIDPDGRVAEISVGSRSGALISHTDTDGVVRQFRITPHGFYLITNPGSSEVRTNLETLASDVQDLKARVAALEA